jgi:hypothetical protein
MSLIVEFTSQLWIFKIVTINVYGHIANRCIIHQTKKNILTLVLSEKISERNKKP